MTTTVIYTASHLQFSGTSHPLFTPLLIILSLLVAHTHTHTHAEVASVWPADRQLLTHAVLWRCVRVRSVDRQCAGLWQRVSARCQGDVFSVTLCWPDLRSDCPLRPHCGSLHNPCCHSHTGLKGSTKLHTHTQLHGDVHMMYRHPHSYSLSPLSKRQIRCCLTLSDFSLHYLI